MIPFKQDDLFTDPEDAARELIRLVKIEMEEKERPFAYTGTINNAFRAGGRSTVESYRAGRIYATEKGWLVIDLSGTRVTLTPEGEEA
ncbi:hypothetical protein [Afipia carboxidovorans]|uniref:hypothetical protein n=1 Tax=Afipia carboxidovorans TaxID=40137 RepID=UPI003090D909|nr:hypothetical protein CRBSH125_08460 [Afipia carboxidovorans]